MEVTCYSNQAELSDTVTEYRNLPYLTIASPVSRIRYLTDADLDHNMPSKFNFNYHSTHDFHSDHDIHESSFNPRSFSALHCNIRSVQGNYDNFAHMLPELQFPFSVIGLSETKFMIDKGILTDIDLPGYDSLNLASLMLEVLVFMYEKIKLIPFSQISQLLNLSDFEALFILLR